MNSISNQLSAISLRLSNRPYTDEFVLHPSTDPRSFDVRVRECSQCDDFWTWAVHIVQKFISYIRSWFYENEALINDAFEPYEAKFTILYFFHIFGESRVRRICNKGGIQVEEKLQADRPFSRGDIEKIFLGIAEICQQDIQELFSEIHSTDCSSIRFLDKQQSELVKSTFCSIDNLNECTKEHVDTLLSILSPFATEDDTFLRNISKIDLRNIRKPLI
jgi:hypothetical protein